MYLRLALTSVCAPLMIMFVAAPSKAATFIGPVYPPPGGVTFSGNGIPAISSGRVATYQGFDLSASNQLFFGIANIGLAMDGAIDASGETLAFNSSLSNLANGIAVFNGTTTVNNLGVNQTAFTRFTLIFTDLSNNPLALVLNPDIGSGLFPVLSVTGDYKVGEAFTASSTSNGSYVAAGTYYDSLQTPNSPNLLQSSFSGGFYYTPALPEPASWGLMLLGFAGVGSALRRARKHAMKPAQLV